MDTHSDLLSMIAEILEEALRIVKRRIERVPPGPRSKTAAVWLVERFREKAHWRSGTLFELAEKDGISRNALFEAKQILGLDRAKKVTDEDGTTSWVWSCNQAAREQQPAGEL